ncbi:hypothetical protein ACPOLB_03300 [Rubrivivax sp. RP6-9]|uniref:hypothetical protein n=1 Tax=Rubrivivax sp. RP6-9 TaxID=3415750 RepID=UPI003CC58E0B
MADTPTSASVAQDASVDTSRLDATLLRYVLLLDARMNMLALERLVQALRGDDDLLRLPAGVTRSDNRHRAAATMQLAVELQLADSAVVRWIAGDALRRQMAIDAAYYPTEVWAADLPMDEPPPLPRAPGAAHDDTDLSPFERHMLGRTRLHESRPAAPALALASPGGEPGAVVPPAPSPARSDRFHLQDALPFLFQVARGVLDVLGPHNTVQDWRQLARARAQHAGFAMPPPEVFDALLVGTDRSLVDNPYVGSWRYKLDGERRFPSLLHTSPSLPAELLAQHILQTEQALRQTLGSAWQGDVFVLLADRLRALPTTPAWPDVQRAVLNLGQGERQISDEEHLRREDDVAQVQEFHAMLKACAPTLVRALHCSAFFSGVADGANPGRHDLLRSLELLADGLQFAASDEQTLAAQLDALDTETATLMAAETSPPPIATLWPRTATSVPLSEQALGLEEFRAWGHGATALRSGIERTAWEQARERLLRFCRDGHVARAGAAELLCAVLQRGPAQLCSLDPRKMSLRQWNRALLAALEQDGVPLWLAVVALQRLGASTLSPGQQDELLAALHETPRGHTASAAERHALDTLVRQQGLWRGSARAIGSAIIVCRHIGSMADAWQRPPTLGMVLIDGDRQLRALAALAPTLLRALPKPLRIEFEYPQDRGLSEQALRFLATSLRRSVRRAVGPRLVRSIPVVLGKPLPEGQFHRHGHGPESRPDHRTRVRDPAGPDDLLQAHLAVSGD